MRKLKRRKLRHLVLVSQRRCVRTSDGRSYTDLWEALFPDHPAKAARGRAKVQLAVRLGTHFEQHPLRATDAAKQLNLPPHRASDLVHGRFSSFSLEELVTISQALGLSTSLD